MISTIAMLGSGEFLPWMEPLDRRMIDASAVKSDRVAILPLASAPEGDDVFDNWARMGIEHYRRIGADPVIIPLKSREDAFRPELAGMLDGAALIFFSGGNPAHSCRVLRGTPFWEATLAAVADGASLGVCSAGVSMLGEIAPDIANVADLGNLTWVDGLRYFPKTLFGLHWDALDSYMPGLKEFVLKTVPHDCCFFAIDEDTATVGDGLRWRVEGRGGVYLTPPGGTMTAYEVGEEFELAPVS